MGMKVNNVKVTARGWRAHSFRGGRETQPVQYCSKDGQLYFFLPFFLPPDLAAYDPPLLGDDDAAPFAAGGGKLGERSRVAFAGSLLAVVASVPFSALVAPSPMASVAGSTSLGVATSGSAAAPAPAASPSTGAGGSGAVVSSRAGVLKRWGSGGPESSSSSSMTMGPSAPPPPTPMASKKSSRVASPPSSRTSDGSNSMPEPPFFLSLRS
mmetsp:Transcript_23925/g.64764  ORF Transcript_23925/g.64764 Transcript_23925/m.64764 type:complete len:211 (-) Transcript_23925:616-1248(-)